ncbi:MAG: hypothetical protein J6C67_03490 [Muribaculaceae bacterium]|nr:hypothetical protein [Muribaculaceae bacterium]
MKKYITKALAAGVMVTLFAGCHNHDLIPDIAEVGQEVPTVYWEVGSTVCKAGESFSFQGKYHNPAGRTPLRSEVWYQVVRDDNAAVTAKLGGASLNYTQTVSSTDTMRSYQCAAVFPHNPANWDGHQNIFSGTVPVSRTLTPVIWADPSEWDEARFNTYYPEGFKEEFLNKVYDYLTSEASADSYYNALRNVYLNYNFTNEQFAAVGLPEIDLTGDDGGAGVKSDTWFSTEEQVGVYFITVGADGKAVYNERPMDYTPAEGEVLYPVYKSSEWVFCRYDDNSGSIVSTVRPEWLPKFRQLISVIPFQDWIFDSANNVYKIDFGRKYSLNARFQSVDSDASGREYVGVVSPTEVKTIYIN